MNGARVFFGLLALLLLTASAASAAAPAPRVSLQSVQANFLQEKHLQILSEPLMSRGVFAFQAPRSLRWEYLYPVRTLLLVHDDSIRKLIEQNGRMVEDPGLAMDSINLVLEEITNWLAGRFTDNPAFEASFPDSRTIVLIPKDAGLAAVISRIELTLQGEDGLLESVLINEGPDTFTRLTFSDALLNRRLAPELFTSP